jgi:hypothetical protein
MNPAQRTIQTAALELCATARFAPQVAFETADDAVTATLVAKGVRYRTGTRASPIAPASVHRSRSLSRFLSVKGTAQSYGTSGEQHVMSARCT